MLIEEIAQYAATAGLGSYQPTGKGGNIFLLTLPDTPNAVMSVFLRGGTERDPNNEYTTASVQIIVRDPSKIVGLERAKRVMDTFNGFNQDSFVDGGIHIVDCLASQGEPVDIGHDGKDRYEWSLNFTVEYKL